MQSEDSYDVHAWRVRHLLLGVIMSPEEDWISFWLQTSEQADSSARKDVRSVERRQRQHNHWIYLSVLRVNVFTNHADVVAYLIEAMLQTPDRHSALHIRSKHKVVMQHQSTNCTSMAVVFELIKVWRTIAQIPP